MRTRHRRTSAVECSTKEEMKRVIFWFLTILVILGAYLTWPRNTMMIPREYASISVPNDVLASSDAIARGRGIFLANCVPCHGALGNGQGSVKPSFGPQPADLTDRTKVQQRTPQYLFWRLSEGGQVEPFRSQGSIMPAWKFQLSETQRWQVIAFIRTLSN